MSKRKVGVKFQSLFFYVHLFGVNIRELIFLNWVKQKPSRTYKNDGCEGTLLR